MSRYDRKLRESVVGAKVMMARAGMSIGDPDPEKWQAAFSMNAAELDEHAAYLENEWRNTPPWRWRTRMRIKSAHIGTTAMLLAGAGDDDPRRQDAGLPVGYSSGAQRSAADR